jgi:hypothetical protein
VVLDDEDDIILASFLPPLVLGYLLEDSPKIQAPKSSCAPWSTPLLRLVLTSSSSLPHLHSSSPTDYNLLLPYLLSFSFQLHAFSFYPLAPYHLVKIFRATSIISSPGTMPIKTLPRTEIVVFPEFA